MSMIDGIIVIIYLVAMMAIGFVVGKGNKTQEDYFLGGRSMPWLPVALSVAATTISANGFIGNPGRAYSEGIISYMQNATIPLACFIAAYITAPMFYHLRVSSLYEYMEMRMGRISRLLTVCQFFINSLLQVSSMVFIPALMLQMVTGWSLNVVVPIIVLCAIVYTIAGGIKAVIWTDAIQMIIMWGGLIFIFFNIVQGTGLGFSGTLAEAAAAGKFDCFDFTTDLTVTNSFLASCLGIFMWTRYFCFDQAQMQRVLTSKSMLGLKKSFFSGAVVMNVMTFIMLFLGALLFVYYDNGARQFETANEIMINFILNDLPVGVVGLVVAAVFAAAMSSVDSLLNSMTTVFTKDIYEQYFTKSKEKTTLTLKQTMYVSLGLGIVIIFIVILGFSGTVKSVLDVVGTYISYFGGPALGSFLLAMLTRKANDKGTAIGFLAGLVLGFAIATTYSISWLITPAIGCIITMVVGYALSFVFKSNKTEEEIEPLTLMGMRKQLIAKNKIMEDGVSVIPFKMDKYCVALLVLFFAQYVFLAFIR